MKFEVLGLLACSLCCGAGAQGIYTCVDAQGRKLSSDRPIPDCNDREQKLLNPSGTVKQRLGPSLTAAERAQQDARDKQEMEERNRITEERRRDRAGRARAVDRRSARNSSSGSSSSSNLGSRRLPAILLAPRRHRRLRVFPSK